MSSIYLKDNIYWYQKYVFNPISQKKDKRIFRSLKTKNLEKAKSRQAKLDIQYDKQYEKELLYPSRPLSVCLSQYLADKKFELSQNKRSASTHRSEKITLTQFSEYIYENHGDLDIRKINKAHILDFRVYRESQKNVKSVSTIALNLRVTRSFFSYCIEKDYIDNHPFSKIKIPKTKKRDQYPKKNEFENLLKIFNAETSRPKTRNKQKSSEESEEKTDLQWFRDNDWFSCLIWIILNTGMRVGEVTILKWKQDKDDINSGHSLSYAYLSDDFERITIHFKRRTREIPVKPLKLLFQKIPKSYLIKKRGKSISKKKIYVFENERNSQPHLTTTAANLWKKFAVDSKLNDSWTIHSLRHGFASYLLNRGESLFVVSQILGHSTLEMLDIYGHSTSQDMENAMQGLQIPTHHESS